MMRKNITGVTAAPSLINEELLRRFDVRGPRYTSYPTADRFVEAFTTQDYQQALAARACGTRVGGGQPLSVYVHVPFCESVCYHCACNKVITKHHQRAQKYLQALITEMDLTLVHLGRMVAVSQLHLGGGSPTVLSDVELAQLMDALRARFRWSVGAEISMEVDPRTVSIERLAHLRILGFNRLSFGVQGFDSAVQKAVHRQQSYERVAALMKASKALGFESSNVDLIYGLPLQTPPSFARTIAHLPQRFKPQRRIDASNLPQAADKLALLSSAIGGFLCYGYSYIGMDHFALATDSLAVAKRQGRLHRNFQGYSTQADCDLVALGVSAIGRVGACYSQNVKTLGEYYDALRQGQLPTNRGLALTRDDIVRRAVIMALMCQGRIEVETICHTYLIDMQAYFKPELERLAELQTQGPVILESGAIQVTPVGWYVVRAVAMVFDRYLQADRNRVRFSRII